MESLRASQASNTTKESNSIVRSALSELLEDAGNCRQSIHQVLERHPLGNSLVSEQQKLRVALDWAHRFLSSGSDVRGLKSSETQGIETAGVSHHPLCRTAGEKRETTEKVWQMELSEYRRSKLNNDLSRRGPPSQHDNHLSSESDDVTWPENREAEDCESLALRRLLRTSRGRTSNHRHHTNLSDCSSNQTFTLDAAPCSTTGGSSGWSGDAASGMEMLHRRECSTDEMNMTAYSKGQLSENQMEARKKSREEPEEEKAEDGKMEGREGKICEDRASSEPAKTHKHMATTTNPSSTRALRIPSNMTVYEQYQLCVDQLHHLRLKKESTEEAATPAEAESGAFSTNPDVTKHTNEGRNKASDPSDERTHRTTDKGDASCTSTARSDLDGSTDGEGADADITAQVEDLRAACADRDPGHQVGVKGREKKAESRGQNSIYGGNGDVLPRQHMSRPQPAAAGKRTGRLNAQTHTKRHGGGTRTPSPQPAGVPVRDWLWLPDELWLSILSLLPLSDLCTVVQVCRRLHTLATDHTLWKCLRIENSTLTEPCLLSMGKRRPRALCLYGCSSTSVTSRGLEIFFTLCRNTLEEVSVTGCVGPGLRGDRTLTLVGQLCDHVTHVDVSWSGATDKGVKALSDGAAGSRLTSVLLNGCHVTNDALKTLVARHKHSLCRLELFGCQFLTATCLQTVYEMCPGLRHLNIGQVPKVTALSLTVTDAILDTLLQTFVSLQSLTLSSCLGVTDVTLHSVSKHTPGIRSLDVSGCRAITDAGVQSLTLGCERLQQVDLSSTGTGHRGIALLANRCSQHLQSVKLSFCHIGSEDILELCRRCIRLKVLHLYGCGQLPTETEIRDVNATVNVFPPP